MRGTPLARGGTPMADDDLLRRDALEYHARAPRGKVSVVPTKPRSTQRDLTLAYSPGVAYPCLEIAEDARAAYQYTSKGNLVAVISNGTAVLGLGDIGPLASKPVMEGKGLLFKQFADIDVFDIEVDATDPDAFVETVVNISKTFGGINLEDIKAPECFEIERRIAERTDIPVMHDDQHGTAIISGAALLNGLEIVGKKVEDVKVVVAGAGASALTCAHYYVRVGVPVEQIIMCDSGGILTEDRLEAGELNEYKAPFAHDGPSGTLADALADADVFLGLSRGGLVSGEMVKAMAPRPLIFALANPFPEIMPEEARAARPDAVVATGRSDFPNQINNVLGFPYIFRGAIDVQARDITDGMKMAATRALADLTREPVPEDVQRAYGGETITFGPNYIIPKPFDPRVFLEVSSAVADTAVREGHAGVALADWDKEAYIDELEARLGHTFSVMRHVVHEVEGTKQRIVFPEGNNEKVIAAVAQCIEEGICEPVLLGNPAKIDAVKERLALDFACEVIDIDRDARTEGGFAVQLSELRARKGVTVADAQRLLRSRVYFGAMMLRTGVVDGFVGGITRHYPAILRPCIEVIGIDPEAKRLIGCYMMVVGRRVMFIADATVNIYPDARTLAEITVQTAAVARRFHVEPRAALLSFSNFGSARQLRSLRIEQALAMARELDPTLIIDGPMQVDTALVPEIQQEYPFIALDGPANVLICPNLAAANIAYKLLQRLGDAEMTGPILSGLARPVHVLQRGDDVRDIVRMAAICAQEAVRADVH